GEGQVMTVKYPDTQVLDTTNINQPQYVAHPGRVYTYTYDTMARPIKLTDYSLPVEWVNNVQYGPGNELRQMSYGINVAPSADSDPSLNGYYTETRAYNSRLQMTRLTTGQVGAFPVLDMEYRYSATQNNGQITQQKDWVSGEEVTYTYDS